MQKPDTHYWRHRPTLFDELPLEVIRDVLFPYLDYESRIATNQLLPRWDRISWEIKDTCNHYISVKSDMIISLLAKGKELQGDKKLEVYTKLYKIINTTPYLFLIEMDKYLRKTICIKTNMLSDYITYSPELYSVNAINAIVDAARKMRDKMTEFGLMELDSDDE